jgi:hypothetical protein
MNVQFDLCDAASGEALKPVERPFMIAKLLGLITREVMGRPAEGLN